MPREGSMGVLSELKCGTVRCLTVIPFLTALLKWNVVTDELKNGGTTIHPTVILLSSRCPWISNDQAGPWMRCQCKDTWVEDVQISQMTNAICLGNVDLSLLLILPRLLDLIVIMGIDNFEIVEEIGRGAFGTVFKVKRRTDGLVYAMKMVSVARLTDKEKENTLNEIRILSSVSSPFIVSYKEAFYDPKSSSLCMILEFADGGDLAVHLLRFRQSSNRKRKLERPSLKISFGGPSTRF